MTSPISSPRPSSPLSPVGALSSSNDPLSAADDASPSHASSVVCQAGTGLGVVERFLHRQIGRHQRTMTFHGSEATLRGARLQDVLSPTSADDGSDTHSEDSWQLSDSPRGTDDPTGQFSLDTGVFARVRADLDDGVDAFDRPDLTPAQVLELVQRSHEETRALLARLDAEEGQVGASDIGNFDGSGRSAGASAREPGSPIVHSDSFESASSIRDDGVIADEATIPPTTSNSVIRTASSLDNPAAVRPASGNPVPPSRLQRVLGFFRNLGNRVANFFRWVFSGLFSSRSLRS